MKTFESKTMDVLLKYNNEAAGLPRFSFLDKVDPERVPVRVLKDKGLAVAKEQLGGNDIHSLLNRSTESNFDLMMELDDYDATNNERLANYRQECQDVVDFCIQNGYATHEDIARETSLEIGKQTYASSAQYQFPIVNAALLHSNYSRDMFNIQKDINIWRNKVIARFIAEEIYRNYDLTLKDTNWLILKAKDAGIVKKPDLDIIAVLLSRKVEVTSQYAMAAEKYAIGESIYSRILVFCGLYLYTLQTQTLREDAYNYEQKALKIEEFEARYHYTPVGEELQEELDKIARYVYRGITSIPSLFSTAFSEFLDLHRTGKVIVAKKANCYTAGFYSAIDPDAGLSEQEKTYLQSLVGNVIYFEDGNILDTPFQLRAEDRFRAENKQATLTPKDQKELALRVGEKKAKNYAEKKYDRNVWVGSRQQGRVVHVTFYASSFKVWLEEFGLA